MPSESTLLVRPEHLNHHGYLFGGRLLEWLDEQAYIAAMAQCKTDANLVTVAIDQVEFKVSVRQGSMLRFRSDVVHVGRTSLSVFTEVLLLRDGAPHVIFSAYVSFVCLNAQGRPRAIAPLLVTKFSPKTLSAEALARWQHVENLRARHRQRFTQSK
jgi:acyl-CoA hydrolase